RILEDDSLGDSRRNAALPLALDSVLRELARKLGQIASRRNLEGEPRQRVGWAALERDRLQTLLARKKGALGVALDQGQADDGGIVCNLPIEIGGGQRGMAEPAHRDHRFPPERRHRRARVASRHGASLSRVHACPYGDAKLRQFRTERKGRKEKSPSIADARPAADPGAIPSVPPVAALADEGALGVKACGRVPVAQLDSSSGFLIRRSQVRVLPGTPPSKTCPDRSVTSTAFCPTG